MSTATDPMRRDSDDVALTSPLHASPPSPPDRSSTCSSENGDHEDPLAALTYSFYSFAAMVPPVTLAMVLTSLATHYINTVEYTATASQSFSNSYQVYDTKDVDGAAALGQATINAIVICAVIGGMTFVIVICFYFKCMCFITGYMVLSSFVLLSVMGGAMFNVAINKYALNIDIVTYVFLLINFAVLGVLSIFYQSPAITPKSFSQFYAIATSVLLAWQLTHFDAITGWALLVALGFYDLCAVLTPCGPLKALVNLMQSREADGESGSLPGLLYEAQLPVARLGRPQQQQQLQQQATSPPASTQPPPGPPPSPPPPSRPLTIPFSLARALNLTLVATPPNTAQPYTPAENLAMVECVRPGDRTFAKGEMGGDGQPYFVRDNETGEENTYLIDQGNGKCYLAELDDDDDGGGAIKLGLGDFIFYSVLVSKAALYSLTTAVICTVVILFGLGATLFLLSVYKMALPALPVSIFAGVTFYGLGRYVILEAVQAMLENGPLYA